MAAGLRDVLAVQGVIPVSASEVSGGLTINQLSGVWITGGTAKTHGFVSWNQLGGVWLNSAVLQADDGGHYRRRGEERKKIPHGGVIRLPGELSGTRKGLTSTQLAALAVMAIKVYYD